MFLFLFVCFSAISDVSIPRTLHWNGQNCSMPGPSLRNQRGWSSFFGPRLQVSLSLLGCAFSAAHFSLRLTCLSLSLDLCISVHRTAEGATRTQIPSVNRLTQCRAWFSCAA